MPFAPLRVLVFVMINLLRWEEFFSSGQHDRATDREQRGHRVSGNQVLDPL
jgi:hypothetical protein